MALKTAEQFKDSLRKMNPTAYILGEKVTNVTDHPLIKPQVEAVAQTYSLAREPESMELLVARSRLTDGEINRFTQLFESIEDLKAKVKMIRLCAQRTGTCFMRCTGLDVMNAIAPVTYEIDEKYGTNYHERALKYIKYVQENDLAVYSGNSDVKGDRSLRPSEQPDPDMYLHIVDKTKDGIIVRGAKAHQSGSLCAHEVLVAPDREMRESDKEYAVCFALPNDSEGIVNIYTRGPLEDRLLEGIDLGNIRFGKSCPLVIYDNVFVPWDRVFMCGEYEFAGPLLRMFAANHRHSHGGCKSGVGDVLIGAAATIAEYNGVPNASHIRSKITDMIKMSEIMYGCCLAASMEAGRTGSGVYFVDPVLANTSKLYESVNLPEMTRLLIDIAGGLVATMPSERDLNNPEIGHFIKKYLKGVADVSTEDRMRMFRLIETLAFQSRDVASHIMGGGSPEAHKITLFRETDLEAKKKLAKRLAGIKE